MNFVLKYFLDTGASACFMDKEFAIRDHLVLMKKKCPTTVEVIDE